MTVTLPGRRGNSPSRVLRYSSRSSRTAIASSACVESWRAVKDSEVVSTQDTGETLLSAALPLVVELGPYAVGAQQLMGIIEVTRLPHHPRQACDSVHCPVRVEVHG